MRERIERFWASWPGKVTRVVAGMVVLLAVLYWVGLLEKYQGLVGTVIGIAVTGTVGFWNLSTSIERNAENVRAQKDRERAEESEALRATLRGELIVIHGDLSSRHAAVKSQEAGGSYVVPWSGNDEPLCRAYRALVNRIGLLSPDEIRKVVRAYSHFEAFGPGRRGLKSSNWIC